MNRTTILLLIAVGTVSSPAPATGCAACSAGAACNGSASCKVCTDCSRCKHCKGGGTCGVCSPAARAPASTAVRPAAPKPKTEITATCKRVIDGDTIEVDSEGETLTVRLLGIDCPELATPGNRNNPIGLDAKAHAEKLILKQTVRLEYGANAPQFDRYKRLLAYAYRESDGLSVNKSLLESGLAWADGDHYFSRLEEYLDAEDLAEANHRGLWSKEALRRTARTTPATAAAERRAMAWVTNAGNERDRSAAAKWLRYTVRTYPATRAAGIAEERLQAIRRGEPWSPRPKGRASSSTKAATTRKRTQTKPED